MHLKEITRTQYLKYYNILNENQYSDEYKTYAEP